MAKVTRRNYRTLTGVIISVALLSGCSSDSANNSAPAPEPEVGQAVSPDENQIATQPVTSVPTTPEQPAVSTPTAPEVPAPQPTEPTPTPAPAPTPAEPTPPNGSNETEQTPTEPVTETEPVPVEPTPVEPEPAPVEPEPAPEEPEPIPEEPEPLPEEPVVEVEPTPPTIVGCTANAADMQSSVLSLVNEARSTARSCGDTLFDATEPVSWNDLLAAAAATHSNDMAQHNFFSHTGSDGSDLVQRVDAQAYNWSTIGENIAAGQTTTKLVVDAWLDSPGHCKNLMNPKFKEIAVTCVENNSSDYRVYWTNVLGTRF